MPYLAFDLLEEVPEQYRVIDDDGRRVIPQREGVNNRAGRVIIVEDLRDVWGSG